MEVREDMSKLNRIFTYFRYLQTIKVPYKSLDLAIKHYDNHRARVVAVRFFRDYVEIDVMPR